MRKVMKEHRKRSNVKEERKRQLFIRIGLTVLILLVLAGAGGFLYT